MTPIQESKDIGFLATVTGALPRALAGLNVTAVAKLGSRRMPRNDLDKVAKNAKKSLILVAFG